MFCPSFILAWTKAQRCILTFEERFKQKESRLTPQQEHVVAAKIRSDQILRIFGKIYLCKQEPNVCKQRITIKDPCSDLLVEESWFACNRKSSPLGMEHRQTPPDPRDPASHISSVLVWMRSHTCLLASLTAVVSAGKMPRLAGRGASEMRWLHMHASHNTAWICSSERKWDSGGKKIQRIRNWGKRFLIWRCDNRLAADLDLTGC